MNFWRKFTSWVTKFYNRLTSAAGKVPRGTTIAEIREQDESLKSIREGAWKLVLKVMKDIFLELASRRSGGLAASKEKGSMTRRSAIVLYSTLRAHKFMAELTLKEFERHPALAPTCNSFLFTERASTVDIRRLEVKLTGFDKRVTGLQKTVDQVAARQGAARGGARGPTTPPVA